MKWALIALPFVWALLSPRPATAEAGFAAFDSLLARIVTPDGWVDYAELARQHALLDRTLEAFAQRSPESHPGEFSTSHQALAYWLNAYNACVLKGVADHYPIGGIDEVKAGALGWVLGLGDPKAAFFVALRFELGGRSINLLRLEHDIILPFDDPRVHFALNCASRGCPPLRAEAYRADRLDAQLDEMTEIFVHLERGVAVTDEAIVVSPIFSWFRSDFTDWLATREAERKPTLRRYLEIVRGPLPDLPIRDGDYDWSLNDAALVVDP